ncbi:ABC transporter C family member 3 [Vitis vinifera]|uniref:ABC-type xenobiotic transporter n=1 Tax=Vitis vinifera TaxID=29760 RepID=A0A438K0X8_VITVI|nr:ABC transporter C family member 3 [Vitis vinifera]
MVGFEAMVTYPGTGFLLNPVFLRAFSASLHLVLLFLLFVSWVCKRIKGGAPENCKRTRNGWSDERLVTLLDLVLRTLAWGAVCVYLHTQFIGSVEPKFPFLLRVWWGFYFSISCYFLVLDIVKKHQSLRIQYLVPDIVYVITGLFLCYSGFLGKNQGEESILREPLLNGSTSISRVESNKSKGEATVTPFSKAGFFSLLTFSWIGPLIAEGNKKTLDLEDVPQLDTSNSVAGVFPAFSNKLQCDSGGSSGVTTLKLVKALIFACWAEILLTAFLVLVKTLASYVGPYLIDTFVQYLNGRREFKNEGYLLAMAFFVAKLVERLSVRHWFFRLQQVGIRIRAVLITMIYNKGLTLSCQSKQGHSTGRSLILCLLMRRELGISVGICMIHGCFLATVIVMLTNVPLGKWQEKFQDKLMESKDKRMKATSEILRNMRILKLQGWEMKFLSKIVDLRKNETGWLKKYLYTSAVTTFVFWGAPTFVSVATFGTCMLLGIPLESGKILSSLATFRILQEPIYSLPDLISMIAQTKVSLDRIASFLRLDDLPSDVIERLPKGSSDTAIEIVDGNFSWDLSSPNPTLKDINLRVCRGMRVAVCGTVGSGKSSLLSCMLGEVPKISGILKLCGTKAYVAQSPWIQSGKIEENILFGKEMDRERYERVLDACSLKKDLEVLSFGDQTVIGEWGINMSGGQKQRIQIARALYQNADIYLFDDPFSAVDAHTGTHLFKECLLGLLGSKTVIYVTHQVEFLPAADLILVMKDGRVTQAGKYNEILNSGTDFMELVVHIRKLLVEKEENRGGQNGKAEEIDGPKGQLVQEEEREKGKVGLWVYWKYIRTAYGGALVPFILLSQILFQLLQIGSNYWMAWASPVSDDVKPAVRGSTLIIVYVALAVGSSFCVLSRAMLLVTAGYKTATILFNKMHLCVFRAPMSFFDATPSGRILNRASADQSTIDTTMPMQVGAFAFQLIQLLGIIAVMSQVAWQVFIVFIPVIATCIWYQGYKHEIGRWVFTAQVQHCWCNGMAVLPLGYAIFCYICLLFGFLISVPEGVIDPGIAGLAMTYGLNLNMIQARVIWNLCNMENKIISVERILQYTSIPSEPPLVTEENRLACSWPSHGEVDIQDLQVRYAPHMPLVLRGLTCTFLGGMKTGIVGRTGSGKSTLIQTLFRIVEPAAGQIMIDGTNISSIGLHDLRTRLSIIPQDPTMFEGTVRSNLDPLEEYSDEQIWEALDKCQLGDEVRKKEGKLDSAVIENGENWSMGQRQLQTLRQHFVDSTVITIAHRITSVLDSDKVLLLDHGLIEEYDTPTRLLENKSSSFAKLVAEYTVRSHSNLENAGDI